MVLMHSGAESDLKEECDPSQFTRGPHHSNEGISWILTTRLSDSDFQKVMKSGRRFLLSASNLTRPFPNHYILYNHNAALN
jgi:hypothetical protein